MKSKKGKGTLKDQMARLAAMIGDDGVKRAQELADTMPDVVKMAFKLIPRSYRAPDGLLKSERKTYFQLKALKGGEANAEAWRTARLVERGLDPKKVGPEVPQTDEEKGIKPAEVAVG